MEKFGIKEVADVTIFDLKTNKPVLRLDTLKMSNIENTASSTSARGGKSNPKLLTWDFDKEITMQLQDALMSTTSLGLLAGNPAIKGVKDIHGYQAVDVADTTQDSVVALEREPIAGSVQVLHNGTSLTSTDFTVTESAVDVTKTVAVGDKLEVFYLFQSDTDTETISIDSDKFPGYYKIVGDTVVRNAETGVDEPFQIVVHKAKIQPGFTLSFQSDGDPSVFDMNLEVFKKDKGTGMVELIKY
jgi:hypothetical protein